MDLLRLPAGETAAILADLRCRNNALPETCNRVHDRNTYTEEALLLLQVKAKPETTPFLVKCVDISAGGLGLLHGGFIHTDLPCLVTLVTRHKVGLRINGRIARCVHVRRHIHLIGVQFNEVIDDEQLAQFELAA